MSLEISLYEIESGLRDLYAMREEALSDIAEAPLTFGVARTSSPELEEIDKAIATYIGAELRKVDGTADFILILDRLCHEQRERKGGTERCEIDREIDRLKARRDSLRGVLAHVKDAVAFVMQGMSWREGKPKKLEGVRHSITLQGNGGKQPVVITDESLVPDELCEVTIKMSAVLYKLLVACDAPELLAGASVGPRVPRLSAIHDALNAPCHSCDTGFPEGRMCAECNGSGKSSVPGCRLAERGSSVVIR